MLNKYKRMPVDKMTKFRTQLFTVILVPVLLYYSERCNSVSDDEFVPVYDKLRALKNIFPDHALSKRSVIEPISNTNYHDGLLLQRLRHKERIHDLKKLENSKKADFNGPQTLHGVSPKRLVRQAYSQHRPALYPSLPTAPSYHPPPYSNNNYPQANHTGYTPPYNPQWQPTNNYNNSQPAYSGYPPSNGNGYNNPGFPSGYPSSYPPYTPRPAAPGSPNPADNPLFNNGYGHRYPYKPSTNFSHFGPQTAPSYQPYPGSSNFSYSPTPGFSPSYNNRPTTPPSHGTRNNTFGYNPSQRPPYNSPAVTYKPSSPPYSTQRNSVLFYNDTTQRTPNKYPGSFGSYNNSGSFNNRPGAPGYPHNPSQSGPYGPYNPGQNYPGSNPFNSSTGYQPTHQTGSYNTSFNNRPGAPGYPYNPPQSGPYGPYNPGQNFPGSTPFNSSTGFQPSHQTGPYNTSYNGYRPNLNNQYPVQPNANNFTNFQSINPGQANYNPYGYNNNIKPNPNSGTGYTHSNFAYPYNPPVNSQSPGTGFYPQPTYNGSNTYRVTDHYNPNIPNQPPRRDNFGPNNFPASIPTQDPTRVAPDRFSY